MKSIVNKTEGIISNPKRAIAFGIICLVIVALFFILKNQITNLIQKLKNKADSNAELNEEISSGGSLSYTQAQYVSFANKLYDSMKGFGTNRDGIRYVFNSMNTKADVLKLIQVFGMRDGETLAQWLKGETWFFKNITGEINQILSSKGIDYRF